MKQGIEKVRSEKKYRDFLALDAAPPVWGSSTYSCPPTVLYLLNRLTDLTAKFITGQTVTHANDATGQRGRDRLEGASRIPRSREATLPGVWLRTPSRRGGHSSPRRRWAVKYALTISPLHSFFLAFLNPLLLLRLLIV